MLITQLRRYVYGKNLKGFKLFQKLDICLYLSIIFMPTLQILLAMFLSSKQI